MKCDDLPAFVPQFAQSVDGVRPSGYSGWVNGIRVFKISNGEELNRSCGLTVYGIVVPDLRPCRITMGEFFRQGSTV